VTSGVSYVTRGLARAPYPSLLFGNVTVKLAMFQPGFYKGAHDMSGPCAASSFPLSKIANATGDGVIQATV